MEHANLGSIHPFMQSFTAHSCTHTLKPHSHIQPHTHTHRNLVNPKHSFELKFRHIPLIEGFALLFMGPSLQYGCFITIGLVLAGLFFFCTALHCSSSTAVQRRGLWFKWLLSTPNPPEAHKSHKGSSKRPGEFHQAKEEVLNPKASLKYHRGDLLKESVWLVCVDGSWASVTGTDVWK